MVREVRRWGGWEERREGERRGRARAATSHVRVAERVNAMHVQYLGPRGAPRDRMVPQRMIPQKQQPDHLELRRQRSQLVVLQRCAPRQAIVPDVSTRPDRLNGSLSHRQQIASRNLIERALPTRV